MISSFRNYLVEEEKTIYFTFGRMNPPTIGHGLLFEKLAKKAGRNPYRIYASHSQDPKKNPLDYKSKVKFIRKMFPRHARSVVMEPKIRNVFDAAVKLYDEGFVNVVFVVGSDRVLEFKTLLNKYNGEKARHGFYNFRTIKVESAGERDPDADDVSGASASKQREAAIKNDFPLFAQGVPKNVSTSDARALFNAVRLGMNLKECREFKTKLDFKPVSEEREEYVKGKWDDMIDQVVYMKESGEPAILRYLGSNYVIVELNGQKKRCWIEDITEEKEMAKWSDIKKLREQDMESVRARIRREKELDKKGDRAENERMKKRHDSMLDRARRNRTRIINRGIDT
jgi:hypothetical protein